MDGKQNKDKFVKKRDNKNKSKGPSDVVNFGGD
jgi:hypothetical protein